MRKKIIYLAGPIHNCTEEEISGWRNQVKNSLKEKYEFIDPSEFQSNNAFHLVEKDKGHIELSDILLVNFWKCSIGTSMEINHAWNLGKQVITIINTLDINPWLFYHSDLIFTTVPEAISYLNLKK